jgi:hypothetical protein
MSESTATHHNEPIVVCDSVIENKLSGPNRYITPMYPNVQFYNPPLPYLPPPVAAYQGVPHYHQNGVYSVYNGGGESLGYSPAAVPYARPRNLPPIFYHTPLMGHTGHLQYYPPIPTYTSPQPALSHISSPVRNYVNQSVSPQQLRTRIPNQLSDDKKSKSLQIEWN